MVNTRSSNMSITTEMQEYFSNLIKPLATNEEILKMLENFKVEVVEKFEERLNKQEEKIAELESTLALRDNVIEKLTVACDDNEQYSRRSCLRINGIQRENGREDNNSVINKLKECYKKIGVTFDRNAIDRVHRIGKTYEDNDGNVTQQIIVKFRNWSDRQKFYKARPRGVKKPGTPSFRVKLDLTKRRYKLLQSASELVKSNVDAKYVFADINCSLVVMMNDDSLCFFQDEKELNDLLG